MNLISIGFKSIQKNALELIQGNNNDGEEKICFEIIKNRNWFETSLIRSLWFILDPLPTQSKV